MMRAQFLSAACAVLALQSFAALADQLPVDPDAAKKASYQCPAVTDPSQLRREAASLSTHTSDKNALACSADFLFQVARNQPNDHEAQVDALRSLLRYIDHVLALRNFDLVQVSWPEHVVRLQHAQELSTQLLRIAQGKWPHDPALQILAAQIDIALAGPSAPKTIMKAVAALKSAVAKDPKALQGAGQLAIGRSLLDLPPIFDGSATTAIPYLEQARELAPQDPRPLRDLVEAYDEVGRDADARKTLRALAQLTPNDSDLQLYADEWRMGEGLAARLNDDALAKQFAAERAKLMHDHPEILLRKVASTFGHGGDDPLSGQPQYIGEDVRTQK